MNYSNDLDISPLKILRQKFVQDLEEILECPICLDRLTGSVFQCKKGHNICNKCYKILAKKICPICKCVYSGTRNFLAQNLITKFEDIKASLVDPTHSINQTVVTDKVSIGIQTCLQVDEPKLDTICVDPMSENEDKESSIEDSDDEMPLVIDDQIEKIAKDIETEKLEKAKFPCQIGKCNELVSHHLVISHVKINHAEYLTNAGIIQGNLYTKKWKIQFRPNSIFDQAIHIDNMGMFFVKVSISRDGDVHGHVQLYNIAKKTEHLRFSLNVGKHGTFISYRGKVLASRILSQDITKGLFIPSTNMKNIMKEARSFYCFLKIKNKSFLHC